MPGSVPVLRPPELMLGPATRLLWRTPDSVQLGMGSRELVVEGLSPRLVRAVARPRGATALPEPEPEARSSPTGAPFGELDHTGRETLEALVDAGYLWPRSERPDDPRLAPPAPRLAGELAALAVRHGQRATEVLSVRRHSSVQLHGSNRLVSHVAALLAAAGVGRVHCTVDGNARLRHVVPGGVRVDDEGAALSAAAERAIRCIAPDTDTTALPIGERADLTLLALDGPVPQDRVAALHADNAAHLALSVGLDHGVVGPLVLPGLTSCLRCTDLHRRDRDPAWSALAAQLSVEQRYGGASEVTLATIVAGVAAQQALRFLDGDEPECLDGTLEMQLPDWRLRRRSWSPHPACDCGNQPIG